MGLQADLISRRHGDLKVAFTQGEPRLSRLAWMHFVKPSWLVHQGK